MRTVVQSDTLNLANALTECVNNAPAHTCGCFLNCSINTNILYSYNVHFTFVFE